MLQQRSFKCNLWKVFEQHLQRLLESDNGEVVMAVLRVLYVLAVPRSTRQIVADVKFTSKLSTLAASWGTLGAVGERLISISSCCLDDVDEVSSFCCGFVIISDDFNGQLQTIGTTVHMEIYKLESDKGGESVISEEGLSVIHIENAHTLAGTESEVFEEILQKYAVPSESQFELKVKLRLARAFVKRSERQQWVRIQIVALTVLAQCQSSGGSAPALIFVNEACIVELIEILQNPRIPLDIQTLALKALTALLSERSRQFSFLITANATSHHGVLPSLIRKFKGLIANSSSDIDLKEYVRFGEGLLGLTWTFAGSNTGASALYNAGIVHMLVPILRPGNEGMIKFLTLAVKTLEVLMNYSQDMQHCFRELNGVAVLVDLAHDIASRLVKDPMQISDNSASQSYTEEFRFENCRLLSSILHLLSAAATPVATTTDVRELASGTQLPFLLNCIFKQQQIFGAGVFEKAAALLTEFVHQEPGCLQQLISAGVAESFLSSISGDFPPSRGVVNSIPSALGALCLSAAGTNLVESAQPLEKLLKSLSSERIVFYLHGDCPSNLGVQLEELMRHNPSLLDSSMGGCVGLVSQIPLILSSLDASNGQVDISRQIYLITAVEFVGKFLEPLMSVAEHARSFIRRGGVKALLDILSLDDLPKNFSRTEAGKYLVLVIGKAASHSASDVLGDLIQRTVVYLKAVDDRCPLRNILETATAAKILEGGGEKQLLDLEMHASLLAGVIASFRVSSALSEWNTPAGSELLQLASRVFVTLRICIFLMSKSNPNSDAQNAVNEPMEIGPESSEILPVDRVENSEVASLEVASSEVATVQKPDDFLAQAQSALAALFGRLTAAIGAPSRRRPDDRALQPSNEKAVGGVLASTINALVDATDISLRGPHASRYIAEVVELLLVCFFGDDTLRSRSSMNVLLLQELVNQEFLPKLGKFISQVVERILSQAESAGVPEANSSEAIEDYSVLSSCLSLVLRLLTTPFNSVDRSGAPVPIPGFDSNLFTTTIKVVVYNAVESIFRKIGNGECGKRGFPSSLTTLLLEFAIQHLKVESAQTASASAGVGVAPARQYDPQTVAALMEMGFDERRVHAALDAIRNNSVELATEWLFLHGVSGSVEDEESEIARAMALSLEPDLSASGSSSQEKSTLPTIYEQRDSQAEALRNILIDVCLEVSSTPDRSSGLPFAVADVLNAMWQKSKSNSMFVKLHDRLNFLADADDKGAGRLGSLLHALSILVNDNVEGCRAAIDVGALQTATDILHKEGQRLNSSVTDAVASWVCPCILFICALLKYLDESKKVDPVELKNHSVNCKEESEGKSSVDPESKEQNSEGASIDHGKIQHEVLILACVAILRRKPDPQLNHAALQLLTRLTRVHRSAAFFMQTGGIQVLLSAPAESSFSGHALLVGSILRHILEDPQTLQSCMQLEIRALLSSLITRNNGRPLSLRAFLSAAATLAQRDPLIFSRAVCASCHVTDTDGRRLIHLTDRKDDKMQTPSVPMAVDQPSKVEVPSLDASVETPNTKVSAAGKGKNTSKLPETSTQLIGILVEQMFALIPNKSTTNNSVGLPGSAHQGMDVDDSTDGVMPSPKKIDDQSKNSTALTVSNILRFLSELVKFFPGCSHALIKCNVPSKQRVDGLKRHSEGFLGFLLCELLPGHIELVGTETALCSHRASQLIAALFGRGSDIRKRVVVEIVRAIQHPSAFTSRGSKTDYLQRLQSMGDLLAMLLSSAKNAQVPGHPPPDTAKVFLDASLPSTIAASLQVVDLQHPLASKVVNALLRPLDLLCASPYQSTRQRADITDSGSTTQQPISSRNDEVVATSNLAVSASPAAAGGVNGTEGASPTPNSRSGPLVSEAAPESLRDDNVISSSDVGALSNGGDGVGAGESSEVPEHHDRNSQGELSRLMAVLRHMERDAAALDGDGSEGSEDEVHGEEDEDDDQERDEGSEDEESTLDVEEEESDDDEDDEDDGAAGENDHGADFLADDLLSSDVNVHEDVGIAWPRSHEIVINNEQELDHLVQRVMQHPHVRMTRSWNGDLEGEGADVEMENDGQLLGFGMPGGARAFVGGHSSGLQEMFQVGQYFLLAMLQADCELQDMQVIQFPGRAPRAFVAGAAGASVRVAVNESSAGSHPLLSRGIQTSGRYSRPGSSRSRVSGIDEYRALMQSSHAPAFLLNQIGGRLVLGEPGGQLGGREESGTEAGWSRWTDDGGGSNAAMRSLSLGLETSIQTALSVARPVTALQPLVPVSVDNSVGAASHPESAAELGSALFGSTAVADNSGEQLSAGSSSAVAAGGGDLNIAADATEAVRMDATSTDAEDRGMDDNDELAMALRLSMESGTSNLSSEQPTDGDMVRENETSIPVASVSVIDVLSNDGPEPVETRPDLVTSGEPSHRNDEESAIDAAFLAELPDELRAEVIAQQSSHTASRWPGGTATQESAGIHKI